MFTTIHNVHNYPSYASGLYMLESRSPAVYKHITHIIKHNHHIMPQCSSYPPRFLICQCLLDWHHNSRNPCISQRKQHYLSGNQFPEGCTCNCIPVSGALLFDAQCNACTSFPVSQCSIPCFINGVAVAVDWPGHMDSRHNSQTWPSVLKVNGLYTKMTGEEGSSCYWTLWVT